MKSLVIYYSHYGNTALVSSKVYDALGKKGEADIFELQYQVRPTGLIKRAFFRIFPRLVNLASISVDLNSYDLICFCIPVWGGRPSAPVTKYLYTCASIGRKKVICCYIYGIESSARKCANYVRKVLNKKGSPLIVDMFVPWTELHKVGFLENRINETLEKIL